MLLLKVLFVVTIFQSLSCDVIQKWSNQQILILINFKSRQQNLSEKISTMVNLKKHFINNGVTIQNFKILEDNKKKQTSLEASPIWFYEQLTKNNRKSGQIGCISNLCTFNHDINSSLPTYLNDLDNKLNWLDKVDIVINWIRNPDRKKRTNFVVLNFEEEYNNSLQSIENKALYRFDVMIGYLMLNMLRGNENQNINILLITGI